MQSLRQRTTRRGLRSSLRRGKPRWRKRSILQYPWTAEEFTSSAREQSLERWRRCSVSACSADSVPVVIPRGEFNVARVEDNRIVLEGGNAIEASQASVASADASPIPPGNVRIGKTDMDAIKPNLTTGMRVYFY